MGAENLETAALPGATVTVRDDVPIPCPQCSYDLQGLRIEDSIDCPECGASFPLSEPLRTPHVHPWRRSFSSVWLPIAILCAFAWALPLCATQSRGGPGAFVWAVVLLLGAAARCRALCAKAVCVIGACVASVVMLETRNFRGETMLMTVLILNALPLTLWAAMWLMRPDPSRATALVMLAIIPGVPGVALLRDAVLAFHRSEFWLAWLDPRPWYEYDQWPMDRNGAFLWSSLLLGVAVALLAAAAVAARRAHVAACGKQGCRILGASVKTAQRAE